MSNPPKPTPASTLTTWLKDILKWKHEIPVPTATIRSVPTDTDGIRAPQPNTLPFGLAQVIDTAREDGTSGITTTQGVDAQLEWLAGYYANLWDQEIPASATAGPWLLNQYETGGPAIDQYLRNQYAYATDKDPEPSGSSDYAAWILGEWANHAKEVRRLHHKTAALTGHQEAKRGTCPKCHEGTLTSKPTATGFEDKATCQHCGLTLDTTETEAAASFRAALRDPNTTYDYWLTLKEIKTIWPSLKAATLFKWAQRGHVRKQADRYNLDDINARKWDTRQRHAQD